ncbi:type VI secretion system ATPase TssH [Kangiella shandongensis]|uniref:type VI secretion system ATPase TssH n=1 Tax=Kangiella shandongensis TaxID=2763258 RepID=UPI001CC1A8EC|nr:type VI secretion system ATPase TssH [Kangiella shandongensis]
MSNNELRVLIDKLNGFCKTSLEGSAGLCLSRSHFYVEIEHWFLKILDTESSDFKSIFNYFQVDGNKVIRDLNKSLERLKTGNEHPPALSTYLVSLIKQSWLQASIEQSNTQVRSGHLLLALLKDDSLSMLIHGISPELEKLNHEQLSVEFEQITADSDEGTQEQGATANTSSKGTPALDQYTVDLTQQARDGELDPVLGREEEIRQLTDILTRRRQNNPILTGEAGVGKTSVIEGFASKIIAGEVPQVLQDVSVRVLDMGLLQAGAGVKGEFENRLKNVIDEVKGSVQPIILFIDEAHTMIGAGGSAGQNDAANLLKPALARGELRVIAATTWAEYKKYFEKDAALTRRFQVVKVEEPDFDTAVAIMRGLTDVMESHHKVRILDEALVDSVKLSQRYIAGRQLPDKSVSLLDTACARVNLSQNSKPRQVEELEKKLEEIVREVTILNKEADDDALHQERLNELESEQESITEELAAVEERWQQEKELVEKINQLMNQHVEATEEAEEEEVDDGDYSADAKDAVDTDDILSELAQLRFDLEKLQGESPMVYPEVDSRVIAEVVSDWTGIPVGKMQKSSIGVSLNLEDTLRKRVVGQDSALKGIAKAMKTSAAKLVDPTKPIGVFLLAGPSGVGKTETALALAEQMYGSEQNITVINMSEFKEEHKVSLLMGSPPGYVGYGEGGVLTEAVRRKPYSVVLLDEVEKAHPGVQDIFYQVFDKGMLKDGEGRDIDFKNTLIIMTSNAGTDTIMKLAEDPETMPEGEALNKLIHEELLNVFKPAFLGRTTLLPYVPLGEDVLAQITRIQLQKVSDRITDSYKVRCDFDESVISNIVSRCTEVDSGARNIQKIINQSLLPELSEHFLNAMIEEQDIGDVLVKAKDGKLIFDRG